MKPSLRGMVAEGTMTKQSVGYEALISFVANRLLQSSALTLVLLAMTIIFN